MLITVILWKHSTSFNILLFTGWILSYMVYWEHLYYTIIQIFGKKNKIVFFISGIILTLLMMFLNINKFNEQYRMFSCLFMFPMGSINVLLYLPILNDYKKSKYAIAKPVTYISLISYSLYLINGLVADVLIDLWQNRDQLNISIKKEILGIIFFLSFWIVSIIWSILQYKYFEVKSTNFLRRKLH